MTKKDFLNALARGLHITDDGVYYTWVENGKTASYQHSPDNGINRLSIVIDKWCNNNPEVVEKSETIVDFDPNLSLELTYSQDTYFLQGHAFTLADIYDVALRERMNKIRLQLNEFNTIVYLPINNLTISLMESWQTYESACIKEELRLLNRYLRGVDK